jgi:hypothetical protein
MPGERLLRSLFIKPRPALAAIKRNSDSAQLLRNAAPPKGADSSAVPPGPDDRAPPMTADALQRAAARTPRARTTRSRR